MNATNAPHPRLVELSEVLAGTWRVEGPDITGQAEYEPRDGGRLLVSYVDFSVGGTRMRVIQHITHDDERDTLIARCMDTMGDEATYTWTLADRTIRVSLDEDSSTYFEATLDEDRSRYVGTWRYFDSGPLDAAETIVYTRADGDEE